MQVHDERMGAAKCNAAFPLVPTITAADCAAFTFSWRQGFVSNMDEWMGAVDCIVTKAGPGTIAEAMIRGLPIMLSAFLPGQEVCG